MKERLGRGITTAVLLLVSIFLVMSAMAWEMETVDMGDNVGIGCAIAVDDDGRPHISYGRFREARLKYATKSGGSWSITEVDSSGTSTSIVLDDYGYPHISYKEYHDFFGLKYARWTGTDWETRTIDTYPGAGNYSSIAIDDSGRPHIAYNTGGGANLKYAFFTGTDWVVEMVDSVGVVGYHCSMALRSGTTAYISYMDGSPSIDLKLATHTWKRFRIAEPRWQFEMVDTVGEAAWGTSIAIGSDGFPQIAYFARVPWEVRVARWTGSEWIIESIASLTQGGGRTSIALDSYGYAHVTYHNKISGALKHAYWDGSFWQTEMIDNRDIVPGRYNSVAVDRENNVHVAYCSYLDTVSLDSELRYAKRGPTTGLETELTGRHFSYRLFQNKPNPCREFTTINYQLPELGHTTLRIYDVTGRVVRTLVDERKQTGRHTVPWDGRDGTGSPVPSGVYFYRMEVGKYRAAKKLLLVR